MASLCSTDGSGITCPWRSLIRRGVGIAIIMACTWRGVFTWPPRPHHHAAPSCACPLPAFRPKCDQHKRKPGASQRKEPWSEINLDQMEQKSYKSTNRCEGDNLDAASKVTCCCTLSPSVPFMFFQNKHLQRLKMRPVDSSKPSLSQSKAGSRLIKIGVLRTC